MRVGLIGYGKMGRGIFSLLAESPLQATVFVRDPAKAADANRKLEKRLQRGVSSGLFPAEELPARQAAYRFTAAFHDLAACDLIIESVAEDFALKVELLKRVEQLVAPSAILTTNSSSFSPTKLGEALQRPQQFAGFHFFHPIQLTSIVEIIVGQQTSPATVETLRQTAQALRRTPIVVRDHAGSAINVLLTGLTCEALYILEAGQATPSKIEEIIGRIARLGPCEALDTIGLTFYSQVLERTLAAYPFRLQYPELLRKLVRDGRDGKYAGKGLFLYREDRPYDDDVAYYRNPHQTHTPANAPADDDSLSLRLLLQVYYGILLLTEMGLGTLDDFSLGIQDMVGLKTNPAEDMRKLGGQQLRSRFEQLAAIYGERYDPAPIARTLAALNTAA